MIDETHKHKEPRTTYAAYVGIDWADKQHAVAIQKAGGEIEEVWLKTAPDRVHTWARDLVERFGGAPVAIGVELSKGALIEILRSYPSIDIYPLNPATTKRYREAFTPSRAKDDMPDARDQLELVRDHRNKLRLMQTKAGVDTELGLLCTGRRKLIDIRTLLCNTLRDTLKSYYPLALEVAGELGEPMSCKFIARWPDLIALKAARPETLRSFYHQSGSRSAKLIAARLIEIATAEHVTEDPAILSATAALATALARQIKALGSEIAKHDAKLATAYAAHPDNALWDSFPGAGKALAPRLAAAWGSCREAYVTAADMLLYSGIAPVTVRSGNYKSVRRRHARPLFLHQSFWEYAKQSYLHCEWAKRYVDGQKAIGKKHSTAMRSLAFKWIRIMFACWKNSECYDDTRYEEALRHKGSPLATTEKTPA